MCTEIVFSQKFSSLMSAIKIGPHPPMQPVLMAEPGTIRYPPVPLDRSRPALAQARETSATAHRHKIA
jgi:hypothetical protein